MVQAVVGKKGEDIIALDLRKFNTITDYFFIASAKNKRQLDVIHDNVVKTLRDNKIKPLGVEGDGGDWILIDYGDIIVHLMVDEIREYYQLERLWKDAPKVHIYDKF